MRTIPLDAARRIALAAQGLAGPRPSGRVDVRHLRRAMRHTGLLQLDSVNVLARAQYLPLFSRLGPYPVALLDRLAYRRGEWFEYWGHAASLLPAEDFPLFRWRMAAMRPWQRLQRIMDERPDYVERAFEEVVSHGPICASDLRDPGERSGPWWGYPPGKDALEYLFARGRIGALRDGSFTRYYDLHERFLPADPLAAPAPAPEDARRALLLKAARRLGLGTRADVADYYRLRGPDVDRALDDLVAAGDLERVAVEGWAEPAFLDPAARRPRRVDARALLCPFDPLVFYRDRVERLFGFHYRIEIYVPAPQRVYGYYVFPFLLGEELVGRVDLKADRKAGRLLVRGAFLEAGRDDGQRVAAALAGELRDMARWLALDDVYVEPRGDLAGALAEAV